MYDFDSSHNITDSSAFYEANNVAIFPLSEKVVNNMEQTEEMGHTSTDVTQHQFKPYGEVDAAVAVTAQEEDQGREERRKKRQWEEKMTITRNIYDIFNKTKQSDQNLFSYQGALAMHPPLRVSPQLRITKMTFPQVIVLTISNLIVLK